MSIKMYPVLLPHNEVNNVTNKFSCMMLCKIALVNSKLRIIIWAMSQKIQKKIVLNVKTLDTNAGNCMIHFPSMTLTSHSNVSQSAC